MQAREAYKRRQEQKRREREEKEAEERRAREEQHQLLLDEQKQKFLDGERITGGMFLEITGRDGFDIHIRTKGTFNRHVRGIDRNGTVSYRKIKGHRTPDFTGCHKAVSAYLAFITEKRGQTINAGGNGLLHAAVTAAIFRPHNSRFSAIASGNINRL